MISYNVPTSTPIVVIGGIQTEISLCSAFGIVDVLKPLEQIRHCLQNMQQGK
ncbi:MAG: hypothetical protein AB2531_05025 [Candidatus Thiodiazotropha sp.]